VLLSVGGQIIWVALMSAASAPSALIERHAGEYDVSHICRFSWFPLRDARLWCSLGDRQHPACVTAISLVIPSP